MPILSSNNDNKNDVKHIKYLIAKLKKDPSQKSIKEEVLKLLERQSNKAEKINSYIDLAMVFTEHSPTESIKLAIKVKQLDKKNIIADDIIHQCNRRKKNIQNQQFSSELDRRVKTVSNFTKDDELKMKKPSRFLSKLNTFEKINYKIDKDQNINIDDFDNDNTNNKFPSYNNNINNKSDAMTKDQDDNFSEDKKKDNGNESSSFAIDDVANKTVVGSPFLASKKIDNLANPRKTFAELRKKMRKSDELGFQKKSDLGDRGDLYYPKSTNDSNAKTSSFDDLGNKSDNKNHQANLSYEDNLSNNKSEAYDQYQSDFKHKNSIKNIDIASDKSTSDFSMQEHQNPHKDFDNFQNKSIEQEIYTDQSDQIQLSDESFQRQIQKALDNLDLDLAQKFLVQCDARQNSQPWWHELQKKLKSLKTSLSNYNPANQKPDQIPHSSQQDQQNYVFGVEGDDHNKNFFDNDNDYKKYNASLEGYKVDDDYNYEKNKEEFYSDIDKKYDISDQLSYGANDLDKSSKLVKNNNFNDFSHQKQDELVKFSKDAFENSQNYQKQNDKLIFSNLLDFQCEIDQSDDNLILIIKNFILGNKSALALEVIRSLSKQSNFQLGSNNKKFLIILYIQANNKLGRYPDYLDKEGLENLCQEANHEKWLKYISKRLLPRSEYFLVS